MRALVMALAWMAVAWSAEARCEDAVVHPCKLDGADSVRLSGDDELFEFALLAHQQVVARLDAKEFASARAVVDGCGDFTPRSDEGTVVCKKKTIRWSYYRKHMNTHVELRYAKRRLVVTSCEND